MAFRRRVEALAPASSVAFLPKPCVAAGHTGYAKRTAQDLTLTLLTLLDAAGSGAGSVQSGETLQFTVEQNLNLSSVMLR